MRSCRLRSCSSAASMAASCRTDAPMFGGTFAAKGGIRPADRFEYEFEDPVLKRSIRNAYDVIPLPMMGC